MRLLGGGAVDDDLVDAILFRGVGEVWAFEGGDVCGVLGDVGGEDVVDGALALGVGGASYGAVSVDFECNGDVSGGDGIGALSLDGDGGVPRGVGARGGGGEEVGDECDGRGGAGDGDGGLGVEFRGVEGCGGLDFEDVEGLGVGGGGHDDLE